MAREDVDFVVNLGDYIYAESLPLARHRHLGARGPHRPGQTRATRRSCARRAHGRTTVPSTRCIAPTRPCGPCTAASRWSRSGTTTSSRTTTPAPRPAGACPPPTRYRAARQPGRLPGVLREHAGVPVRPLAHLPRPALRTDGRPGHARPARRTGTTSPAATPSPRLPRLRRAARRSSAATQLGWLKRRLSGSGAAWKIIGNETMVMPVKVTGDSFVDFDSWHGLSARARGAARAHPLAGDRGRGLRHGRHPHVHRR